MRRALLLMTLVGVAATACGGNVVAESERAASAGSGASSGGAGPSGVGGSGPMSGPGPTSGGGGASMLPGCGTKGDMPCPDGMFCDFFDALCGTTDRGGVCEPKPTACDLSCEGVCGC